MRKNKKYSPELKIRICEELLENNIAIKRVAIRENIDQHTIRRWLAHYNEDGKDYFYEEHRGKNGGNPYAALHTSKSLSNEERLKLENLKLKIENERLKKGYMVEGAGASKEFVILKDVNSKS